MFQVIKVTDLNHIEAVCKSCQPKTKKIKGSVITTTNFVKHLKIHQNAYTLYLDYKKVKKSEHKDKKIKSKEKETAQGAGTKQTTLHKYKFVSSQHSTNTITKKDFEIRQIRFVIDTMSPLSIVEHPSFIQLFDGFDVEILTRNTLTRRLSELFQERQAKIKAALLNTQYVCTTADIWSGKRKSFFGVTCHWIADDLSRQSATLACQRFKGTHSYDRIASILEDIHMRYGLDDKKIVATITDNGSNFVKSFKEFGITVSSICIQDITEEEDTQTQDSEELDDRVEFVIIGDENYDNEENLDKQHRLPKHLRCASHTLNLICTTDLNKAISDNVSLKLRHSQAMAKCGVLWKKATLPKSAEVIMETLGHTLSYPGVTRWNSFYDAINKILKSKDKLEVLFERLNLENCFTENEVLYLEEYKQVMQPLADTLDVLQGEANTYYGLLIPCLAALKNKLEKLSKTNLKFALPLVRASLQGLESRFQLFFTLDPKINDAMIASVVHPQFKLRWFSIISKTCEQNIANLSSIEKIVINEANKLIDVEEMDSFPNEKSAEFSNTFFDFDESESLPGRSSKSSLTQTANLIKNKAELEYLRYMSDIRTNINMLNDYPTIKKIFIKYNTPLPSSAAVERLFSFATIINSPRRHALSDDNFEKLVVLKNYL